MKRSLRVVTAIVCERGIARPPFAESLRALAEAPAVTLAAPRAAQRG